MMFGSQSMMIMRLIAGVGGDYIIDRSDGISDITRSGASHQPIPLHRQAQPFRQQQIKNPLHRNNPIHLPRMLPDPHLRSATLRRQRPLLLDASHTGLQQRHPHVAWTVACRLSWMDSSAVDRHRHYITGYAQPSGS